MSFREDIIDKIGRFQDIPSLPDVVSKLSRMMSDVSASADDISKLVQEVKVQSLGRSPGVKETISGI